MHQPASDAEDFKAVSERANSALKQLVDIYKYENDVMKQLTTISSGILILAATFHERLAAALHVKWAIAFSILALLVCVLFSVKACLQSVAVVSLYTQAQVSIALGGSAEKVSKDIVELITTKKKTDKSMEGAFRISHYCFALGVVLLGIFIIYNL